MNKFFEEGYKKILMEEFGNGNFDCGLGERRHSPRIKLDPTLFTASVEPNIILRDVSQKGLSLFADQPLSPGNKLSVILIGMVKFVAEVVSCDHVNGHDQKEFRYIIRCVFEDADEGIQMMITGKELEIMA